MKHSLRQTSTLPTDKQLGLRDALPYWTFTHSSFPFSFRALVSKNHRRLSCSIHYHQIEKADFVSLEEWPRKIFSWPVGLDWVVSLLVVVRTYSSFSAVGGQRLTRVFMLTTAQAIASATQIVVTESVTCSCYGSANQDGLRDWL